MTVRLFKTENEQERGRKLLKIRLMSKILVCSVIIKVPIWG